LDSLLISKPRVAATTGATSWTQWDFEMDGGEVFSAKGLWKDAKKAAVKYAASIGSYGVKVLS
jgi:hypothetical protein